MEKITVARLGRSVGLRGDMRFHLLTDFPEQFKPGTTFESDRGPLVIEYYNPKRGIIKFKGIDTPEEAKKYTNAYLYSDIESTKNSFQLQENEYFWFDILDSAIYENGEKLGIVKDIQRLPSSDYLLVETDEKLKKQNFAKSFLIPFIDRFIQDVDIDNKKISVTGAKEILEAS